MSVTRAGTTRRSMWPSAQFLLFYTAYACSQIGDNLWTFAILFILEQLGSMRLVGIYQLVEGVFVMFLSAYVWKWMDKYNRKKGTLTVLALNNIALIVSALAIVGCLTVAQRSEWLYVSCMIVGILACAFSRCAGEGEKLSFTKDWIVVMAQREHNPGLSNKNAIMTIIEQASQVLAPLLTSYTLVYGGYRLACLVFIGANLVTWFVEHLLLSRLYSQITELHSRRELRRESVISTTRDAAEMATFNSLNDGESDGDDLKTKVEPIRKRDKNICAWVARVSRTFWQQDVFAAGICLALMFMTVLGFDGLSISYGKAYGLSDVLLGWFKSASAVLGVIGALSYSVLEKKVGVRWTGLIGLSVQQLFLWFCVASIFMPGTLFDPSGYIQEFTFHEWWSNFKGSFEVSQTASVDSLVSTTTPASSIDRSSLSIIFYFVGVTFARIGVWITDLAIMQVMQEAIREEDRLSVFGVENALCQFFFVGKDVMAILLPDPKTYGILIIVSVLFVLTGFAFYMVWFWKTKPREETKPRVENK